MKINAKAIRFEKHNTAHTAKFIFAALLNANASFQLNTIFFIDIIRLVHFLIYGF